MILQNLTRAISQQNYYAVILEFLIVIAGVVIGFQINGWNEAREDKARTQSYFQRLVNDFEAEKRALNARIEYYRIVEGYASDALETLYREDAIRDSVFFIDVYQSSQMWTYTLQRATYDELLASGIADAIPDQHIRSMLANLYVNADAMHQLVSYQPPYRQSIRSHLPHEIQSRVREECGDIFVPTDDNLLILAIPETCELSFSDALLEQANMAINGYDRFELELTQRLADLDVKSRAIEAHISVLDSIIVELCNYDLGPSDC